MTVQPLARRAAVRMILVAIALPSVFWGWPSKVGVQAPTAVAQVTAVSVRHVAGQTFVTWREVDSPPLGESATMGEVAAAGAASPTSSVRYRIYRSTSPIASLAGLESLGEVPQLSAWNTQFYGVRPPGNAPAFRYAVAAETPLSRGTGLFVHNPSKPGSAYYAVTALRSGTENQALGAGNSLSQPVLESVGQGVPVLQRIERPASFKYIDRPTLHYYVRWESPPNSSVVGRPFDYLVEVPPGARTPAPAGLHMHCWGASLTSCSGWWFNAEKGAVHISSNQIPYDWWTGYHEGIGIGSQPGTPDAWKAGVVRPYTQRRLLSFLEWAAGPFKLDLTRAFAGGESMGGTGALMLAVHYPEKIAWAVGWVGVHVPEASPTFKSSFEGVYGKPEWGIKFEDGTPVWQHFNSAWFLRQHPERDIPFLTFANGKNDGAIGWPQAVDFLRALQETRQPHRFNWGQFGHGMRAYMPADGGERVMPLDIRTDQSLPAFTRCTLDDDPGDGSAATGSQGGQVNGYMVWDPGSIADEPDRWEVNVQITQGAPRNSTNVDITPRRLQRFKVARGDRIAWTSGADGNKTPAQSGIVTADESGLVTIPQVEVTKASRRIQLKRAP